MTTPETPADTRARRRPWYRLHFTTYVLLLLAAGPLALSNLVEEEEFALIDLSAPGVAKFPTEDGVPLTVGRNFELYLRHTDQKVMLTNEYGWPQSWVWFDSAALGPSFSSATSRVDYRALAENTAAWCAVLAATAFLGELARRRFWPRLQWNLRAMLVAVGGCCALLAWCAAWHRQAIRQDAIIAQIEAVDGGVHLKRWGPRWLNLFGADRYRRTVVGVALGGVEEQVNLVPVLKLMPSLPGLRRLDLDGTALTETEVAHLVHLTNLEELFVNDTGISDAGLAHLRGLTNLRLLHLGGCQISDDGLAHLRSLIRLESLYLPATAIRGHGLKHLSQLPRLRLLDLAHSRVEPAGLRAMTGFQGLEELYLHCTAIDDAAVIPLARLPRLRLLDLTGSRAGDRAVEVLSKSRSLEDLALDNDVVSGRALDGLKSLKSLKALHLDGNPSSFDFHLLFSGGKSILKLGSARIPVSRSEKDAVAESLNQLRAASPCLVIDGSRPIPPERRTGPGQRSIDTGACVDEYPRYGGGGIF